jgi:class 3 adenylate cyclase/pimeloyl-ACP methyl ester carboxylesterase
MEQTVGFCTTSDGVSVAYATVGEGPPLVYVCGWPGHLSVEWEKPFSREFLHRLADGFTLVRYDMRGSGLSDRDVAEPTLDNLIADLEAVVDQLQLEQFTLLSLGMLAGPIAIKYAAAHPERVSGLILSSAYLRGPEITTPERQQAIVQYIATFGFPQSVDSIAPGDVEKWQDVGRIRDAASPRELQAAVARMMLAADLTDDVKHLSMPVLIVHGQSDETVPFAQGRALAAGLPHARFVAIQGSTGAPWQQVNVLLPEIRKFLGVEAAAASHPAAAAPASGLVTVLFTDIVDSTSLTQRLGDEQAQSIVRAHNAIVREALRSHGGSEIKHTGDGIMASFPTASGALDCAIAIQREVAAMDDATALGLRIGVNAGEPVVEEGDLYGTAVQLAKRICDRADAGEVLVSNVVRELAAGKTFLFADRGAAPLKGFEDPVRLYEVRWRES